MVRVYDLRSSSSCDCDSDCNRVSRNNYVLYCKYIYVQVFIRQLCFNVISLFVTNLLQNVTINTGTCFLICFHLNVYICTCIHHTHTHTHTAQSILCRFPSAVTSMAVHPLDPHYLAVGLGDGTVRLLDRRRADYWQSDADPSAGSGSEPLFLGAGCSVARYCPAPLRDQKLKITSVNFNHDGTQILASYSEDYVYPFNSGVHGGGFDVSHTPRQINRPQYLSQCERYPGQRRRRRNYSAMKRTKLSGDNGTLKSGCKGTSSTSCLHSSSSNASEHGGVRGHMRIPPAVKRIRLRGDWSDTGPEARPENLWSESVQGGTLMNRMSRMFARWMDMSLDNISGEEDGEVEGGEVESEEVEGGEVEGEIEHGRWEVEGEEVEGGEVEGEMEHGRWEVEGEEVEGGEVEGEIEHGRWEVEGEVVEGEEVEGEMEHGRWEVEGEEVEEQWRWEVEGEEVDGEEVEERDEMGVGEEGARNMGRWAVVEGGDDRWVQSGEGSGTEEGESGNLADRSSDMSLSDSDDRLARGHTSDASRHSENEPHFSAGSASRVVREASERAMHSAVTQAVERAMSSAVSNETEMNADDTGRSSVVRCTKVRTSVDGEAENTSVIGNASNTLLEGHIVNSSREESVVSGTAAGVNHRTDEVDQTKSEKSADKATVNVANLSSTVSAEARSQATTTPSTPPFSPPLAADVREASTPATVAAGGRRSCDQSCDRPHDHSYRRSRFRVQRKRDERAREREGDVGEGVMGGEGRSEEGADDWEEESEVNRKLMREASRSVRTHLQPFMVYKGHRNSRTMVSPAAILLHIYCGLE